MLVYTGGFIAEWIKRTQFRSNGKLTDSLEQIQSQRKLPPSLAENLPAHIGDYTHNLANIIKEQSRFEEEKVEDLNQQKHYALLREVDKIRLIVRIGPSLGLMGTLIPMGTGLAGLTKGNMAQLSSSLILAFTTTVVGLALGITDHTVGGDEGFELGTAYQLKDGRVIYIPSELNEEMMDGFK